MKNETLKKVLEISLKIVTWLLIAFTIVMMVFTLVSTTMVGKNERHIFGYQFFTVLSESMEKSETNSHYDVEFFNKGDIIIAKRLNNKEKTALKVGDVIAFISSNEDSYGQTVTHMIQDIKRDPTTGALLGYVTLGVNNDDIVDEALVEPEYVFGKYSGKIPGLGWFFDYIKNSPAGYFLFIFLPFALLILYNGANVIILFRKYKKQQNEMMAAERAEIAAERKQTEEMLKELQALKAQLEQQTGNTAPAEKPTESPENPEA